MNSAAAWLAKEERAGAVVASPNAHFRQQVMETLQSSRWLAVEALGGAEALAKVEAGKYQALLLDRWLPDLDVNELIKIVRSRHPQVEVLVLDSRTGNPVVAEQVPRHSRLHELLRVLQGQGEPPDSMEKPEIEPAPLRAPLPHLPQAEPLPGMIGTSEPMLRVFRLVRLVIPRDTTLLVRGETGTGKELVAQAIHQLGPRTKHPFIVVNCAAIPESLLESELFGYARGAFTGAFQSRLGRIHSAQGGTLLLDEVGELPLNMQAKLLRFLQEGEVQPLGSPDLIRVDVRVIAATNAHLARRVTDGRFREDLYYRLAVFPIDLAPLRDRKEDIVPLATHFLSWFCRQAGVTPKTLSPEATRLLEQYPWPGNVRELQHVIERAFILAEDQLELRPEHFSLEAPGK